MPPDQLEQLGTALAGRYSVERELGRGGMATVYLADDLRHQRKVAIKVLRPELGSVLGPERFTREIRMAAGLTHPHILPLHDSGEAGGLLFYVMPYVRGESLRQRLSRQKQLPTEEAAAIVRQVAAALDHAHGHGLVHRDIKPENILLHEGEAMVTDFGIALAAGGAAGERLTATGLMVGTPEYMSPEQAAGERTLDPRSDIYSLGCVLYEMLAGEPPYTGPTAQAVIAKRFIDPVPRVRRLRPAVPAAVEEAVMRALARVPADRFASAGALAEALTGPASDTARAPSVAVLPFRNLSTDPENEYFADGITEDVIAQLSKVRALKVISSGSVMRFKNREQSLQEIGAALDVSTLLEGSVRRAGSRVRIVAELIDAETNRQLWAETYDRELTDIFAIQSDVALQITGRLEAELSPEERSRIRQAPTDDIQAYQSYLLGKHCVSRWTQEGVDQRPRCVPGAGVDHQAGRLVHDQHGRILVGDAQRDRLRPERGVGRGGELHGHLLTAAQAVAGAATPAVDQGAPVGDEPLGMCAADAGHLRHREVETPGRGGPVHLPLSGGRAHGVAAVRRGSSRTRYATSSVMPTVIPASAMFQVGKRVSPKPTLMKSVT